MGRASQDFAQASVTQPHTPLSQSFNKSHHRQLGKNSCHSWSLLLWANSLRGEKVYWHLQLTVRHWGKSGQKHEAKPWKHCFLAPAGSCPVNFLTRPRTTGQGYSAAHSGLCPPAPTKAIKTLPTETPTGRCDLGKSFLGSSRLCQVDSWSYPRQFIWSFSKKILFMIIKFWISHHFHGP